MTINVTWLYAIQWKLIKVMILDIMLNVMWEGIFYLKSWHFHKMDKKKFFVSLKNILCGHWEVHVRIFLRLFASSWHLFTPLVIHLFVLHTSLKTQVHIHLNDVAISFHLHCHRKPYAPYAQSMQSIKRKET